MDHRHHCRPAARPSCRGAAGDRAAGRAAPGHAAAASLADRRLSAVHPANLGQIPEAFGKPPLRDGARARLPLLRTRILRQLVVTPASPAARGDGSASSPRSSSWPPVNNGRNGSRRRMRGRSPPRPTTRIFAGRRRPGGKGSYTALVWLKWRGSKPFALSTAPSAAWG